MLAVVWPFGFPTRFTDTGGAQTRCAQTMRAFSPVSAALLGHTTRPGETGETMNPFLMAGQFAESILSLVEGLKQGPPRKKSARPHGRTAGVGNKCPLHHRKSGQKGFQLPIHVTEWGNRQPFYPARISSTKVRGFTIRIPLCSPRSSKSISPVTIQLALTAMAAAMT